MEFIDGLKKHNINYEDFIKQNWKYAGGDKKQHYNYFKLSCPDLVLPEHKNECICGHHIVENCFIRKDDKKELLIVGNCCIKKFVEKQTRTCKICNKPHQNRKVNKCNDCRIFFCDICDGKLYKSRKICWGCKRKNNNLQK